MKLLHSFLLVAVVLGATHAQADRIVIKGSDTLGAKLVPQLAEHFKAQMSASLAELATKARPPVSKSAVHRRLRTIVKLADN